MSATLTGKRIVTFAVAALFAGTVAMAQQQPNGSQTQPAPPNQQNEQYQQSMPGQSTYPGGTPGAELPSAKNFADQAFVRKMLMTSAEEARMSQIAEQKSPSPDVKQFGEKMVAIHNQFAGQLSPIAKGLGVSPVQKLSKKQKRAIDQLQALSGPSFDSAYLKAMVKDQEKDVKELKTESSETRSPAIRQAAKMDEPVFQQHLQILEQLAQSHNVTVAER